MVRIRRCLVIGVASIAVILSGCDFARDRLGLERANDEWLQQNQARISAQEAGPEPEILPVTHFAAGQLFEQQGQLDRAIQQYRKAVELNPKFIVAHNRLGICLDRIGRPREAERVFREAVRLDPERPYLRNNLAFNLIVQRRWQEGEQELRKTLQLRPGYDRARVNLAITLSKQGRGDQAFEQFRMVLGEAMAHYNLGLLYKSDGAYREAAASFRSAIAIEPKLVGAKLQLEELRSLVSATDARPMKLARPVDIPSANAQQMPGPAGVPNKEAAIGGIAEDHHSPTQTRGAASGQAMANAAESPEASGYHEPRERDVWTAPEPPRRPSNPTRVSTPSEFKPEQTTGLSYQGARVLRIDTGQVRLIADRVEELSPPAGGVADPQPVEIRVHVVEDQTASVATEATGRARLVSPDTIPKPEDEFPVPFLAEPCEGELIDAGVALLPKRKQTCADDDLVDQFVISDGGYESSTLSQRPADSHVSTEIDPGAQSAGLLRLIEETVARWMAYPRLRTIERAGAGLSELLWRLQADLMRHRTLLDGSVEATARDQRACL